MNLALRSLCLFLQKGRAETLTAHLTDGEGNVVRCTAGTFSLYDASGVAVVDAEPASVSAAGVASYALPADFADDYTLPQDPWRASWALTGLGAPHDAGTFEQSAYLCRVAPVMRVTMARVNRMHPEWGRQTPRAFRAYPAAPVEDAWEELLTRLLADGHLPHRLLNPDALSVIHRYWAAHLVARAFATDIPDDSRWERRAEEYWARCQADYEQHFSAQRDDDEDGVADAPGQVGDARPGPSQDEWPWGQRP